MKSLIKIAISCAVQNDTIWTILNKAIVQVAHYAERERKMYKDSVSDIATAHMRISPDLIVKHGPFKGMKYPKDIKQLGGALIPKFLGSYEREIHPLLEKILLNDYSEIVNIGCAEGYYAVGLGMRLKSAKVFAYDINKEALRFCEKIAHLNGVADRLFLGEFCDYKTLKTIPFTRKALIISDCEGYERELFIEEIVPLLACHDLLIEIHDGVNIETSSIIRKRFENTHLITAVQSLDDITKAHLYYYNELNGYSLATRKWLLSEGRPYIMEWFYLTPKNRQKNH